jgi:hypothetical protein
MKRSQNMFFLVVGLIFLILGWQSLPDSNPLYGSYSKWWTFSLVLFGGLVIGKWLADYSDKKKK